MLYEVITGKVLAYALMMPVYSELNKLKGVYLSSVRVSSDVAGQGIGVKLIKYLISNAVKLGYKYILAVGNRITSYNVCYTKLLRSFLIMLALAISSALAIVPISSFLSVSLITKSVCSSDNSDMLAVISFIGLDIILDTNQPKPSPTAIAIIITIKISSSAAFAMA